MKYEGNVRNNVALIAMALFGVVLSWRVAAAGPPAPVSVRVVNTPLSVEGTVTGAVDVDPAPTVTLLEMVGLPMNFQTTEPLDMSTCGALRIVVKSPDSGPSLLLQLVDSSISTVYFAEVFPSGEHSSQVVNLPTPTTDVSMGISGDCPGCALAIYCR